MSKMNPSAMLADHIEGMLCDLIGQWYEMLALRTRDPVEWRSTQWWMFNAPNHLRGGFPYLDRYRMSKNKADLESLFWVVDALWLSVIDGPYAGLVRPLRECLYDVGGEMWMGVQGSSSLDRRLAKGVLGERFEADS